MSTALTTPIDKFLAYCRSFGDRIYPRAAQGIIDVVRPGMMNPKVKVREIAGFARVGGFEHELQVRLDPIANSEQMMLKVILFKRRLNAGGVATLEDTIAADHYAILPQLAEPRKLFEERAVENLFSRLAAIEPVFLDLVASFNSLIETAAETDLARYE